MVEAKLVLRPFEGQIIVGGTDLAPAVRSIQLCAGVDYRPELVLNLVLHEVEVDGEITTTIPDRTREALVALGWTPPAEQAADETGGE
ncbi:MAG: hypothetical protein ACRDQ1_17780 [Sciscionella sp.]